MSAVDVAPVPFVKPQYFDANGDPLGGGFIFAYDAGTLNPKDTYTDSSGSSLNSNPIVLDAGGYANIWLAAGAYKFIAFDAAMVQQWSIDGVPGFQSLTFLQDPGSNGIVVRTAAGITTARTIIGTANRIVVTNGDGVFANPIINIGANVAVVDASNAWAAGVKQTFSPNNINAGVNVGANAAEPSAPATGDIFYDSNTNQLKAYINGAWVPLVFGNTPAPGTPAPNTIYQESYVKGWVKTSGTGIWTIDDDLNVSTIIDNGVGNFTIVWVTPFADGNYCISGNAISSGAGTVFIVIATIDPATCNPIVFDGTGMLTDPDGVCMLAIGKQ